MATTTEIQSKASPPRTSSRIWPENWLQPMAKSEIFAGNRPLELDLGCGKGRFLLARASACPEHDFLGIERQLVRIRKVDKKILRQGLENVHLLRMEGYYAVRYLLPEACLDTCYVLFPDPWPKKKHEMHRIMKPLFMDALHKTLKPGATLHFASDHLPYFYQVARTINADSRFSECEPYIPRDEERSDFELIFRDHKSIGRISWVKRVK